MLTIRFSFDYLASTVKMLNGQDSTDGRVGAY